ncbi:MAG TPA: RNA methyltransferase [Phycisphaerae bacterium]|nr:RNA methyltransferase [Phycisphaerae bacterium]
MTERIDSAQNPRIKATARLRERRARKQTNQILIDGGREILRAIESGVEFVEAYSCESLLHGADARAALGALQRADVRVTETSEAAYAKIGFGERDEGVVAVARRPALSLDALRTPSRPLIAVIEGVEKPGNLGAILRSADAAGIDAIIVADARGDIYGPNAIRASLGAIFTRPVVEATSAATLDWLVRSGVTVLVATPEAERLYTEVSYSDPVAIVLGAEASGVSDIWLTSPCVGVKLPMRGRVDSLNVSTAAAVLFYEALRQRESASRV